MVLLTVYHALVHIPLLKNGKRNSIFSVMSKLVMLFQNLAFNADANQMFCITRLKISHKLPFYVIKTAC